MNTLALKAFQRNKQLPLRIKNVDIGYHPLLSFIHQPDMTTHLAADRSE